MRTLLILLLSLLTSPLYAKEDMNTLWQKANKYYQQKDYENAAAGYEKIAATKPDDAVVYFNLGNAYYKLNQIGPAVLNYERALHMNPGYKEAEDNLAIAQTRIGNRLAIVPDIFFVRWWRALTSSNNAGTWAVISLLLFLFLIGNGILKRVKNTGIRLPLQLRAGLGALLILCIICGFTAASNKTNYNKAVVMQLETPFYISTQQTKPAVYVPEGTTVKCNKDLQGWVEVVLPDGRVGWIRNDAITRI